MDPPDTRCVPGNVEVYKSMAIFKDINEESLTEFHNCFFLLEGLGLY
jgi:hypothetical protein